MDEGAAVLSTATNGSQPSPLHRRGVLFGTSAAIVLGVATGCGTAGHQAGPPSRATAVAVPGSASAVAVVQAYIAAPDRHDVALASSMLTAEHLHTVKSEADSWFTNINTITALHVGIPVAESTGGGDLAAGYKQAMRVPVTFTLEQKHVQSMPNGVSDWGYLLVRNTDAQPWRISDEGVG